MDAIEKAGYTGRVELGMDVAASGMSVNKEFKSFHGMRTSFFY